MATVTITVLFTDLVGSTALLSRVGEDQAEALRREHFALLREAIAGSGGREVKNLGDGLMVVVPSAADAVAAAVAIQQAFERRNRDAVEPLLVRVGVALGDADLEDDDYFGVPVVEAARLCAKADGGEILVTDIVRALAGSRGGFDFAPVGALELKGLEQPVVAHRVQWTPTATENEVTVPLPVRIGSVTPTFVGRAAEREVLSVSLKVLPDEGRRVVLLSGEPGIGKTTLASSFAKEAFETGAVVLYGHCDEDLGIPYQAWSEALGHLVRHAPESLLAEHVAARGGELVRLVPDLAARVPVTVSSTDAESERYLLFGAVTDVLMRMSALAPVVLVLDDLQWADRPTVQLLRHVVTSEVTLRMLVIGTFRSSEITSEHPLAETLAALHRESGVERLALRGLGDDELLSLLETIAGHDMAEEGVVLRDALLAETEGNPFFVGEMLRHLAETNSIYQGEDGRWVASPDLRASGLPVSIREVIGRRIARLGAETQRVLSLASVIGRDFDVDVLVRIADVGEDAVLDLCDDAVTAGVLSEGEIAGRYAFAHGLVEHALYDALSAGRAARAHRAVAAALEEICGDNPGERVGELAYHWAHATRPEDGSKAIDYAQRAGDRALAQLAPDEARRWYGDALELLDRVATDDARRRAELLFGMGEAQRQTGDPAHRETLLDAARRADAIDAIDLLIAAVLANSRGWASGIGSVDDERIEMASRALDRLGERDSPERARLLALLCAERIFGTEFDEQLALAEEAVAVARRTGDKAALMYALFYPAEAIAAPQTLELRIARITEACALADELGDAFARYHSYNYRWEAALETGDIATVKSASAVRDAEGERVGQPTMRWNSAFHHSWMRMLDGDTEAAERAAESALELGTVAGQPDALFIYGIQLMSIRWMQGRYAEMVPVVQQAANDNLLIPALRPVLALALCFTPDHEAVRQTLDKEIGDGFPMPIGASSLTAYALWADATARLRHAAAASVLHERLAPWRTQFVTSHVTVHGNVAHYLALLEHVLHRYDDADASFEEALGVHEHMEAPFFVAWTKTAWAALLVDRGQAGDLERARTLATEALPVAVDGGFGDVAQHAQALVDQIDAAS